MNPDTFGELVGQLDYPMLVVTAADGERRGGCLVGFATQSSINPPRYLVCLSPRNHTFDIAARATTLAVHVLAPEQHALATLFGERTGDEVDKFERCAWRAGPDGTPILTDCARWFTGRVLARFDAGDHVAFLLEPVAVAVAAAPGQLGFQAVRDLRPGHPP